MLSAGAPLQAPLGSLQRSPDTIAVEGEEREEGIERNVNEIQPFGPSYPSRKNKWPSNKKGWEPLLYAHPIPQLCTNSCTRSVFIRPLIRLHYIIVIHTPFTPKVISGASTKLCMTVSICQCEQMSFQLPFESTYRVSVSSWRAKGNHSKLSVWHKRSFSRRTCASIVEVHIGKCSKI